MVRITGIEKNSAAEKNNIKPGDFLISINDFEINDILDYKFYLSENKIDLKIKRGEDMLRLVIKKARYADIGLEFENYMMDEKKSCGNSCIFCFVEQLPANCLRESLYFKDDDERLSFLHGNYITLTNLEPEHIDRIIKFKISPVNISVHTTNPELRVKMMRNKRAGEVLKYIKKLDEHNININAQIVLCKDINDGAELKRTLSDLCALESVLSVAVVPAGLTKFRDENNLYKLGSLNKQDCEQIIDLADKFGEDNLKRSGSRIVYCADELYLKAERDLPDEDYYEDYPQYENGVGMIRSFCADFYENCKDIRLDSLRKVSIVTGEAAYALIKELSREIEKQCENLICEVYKIENKFFGGQITVAGLVTGGDIIEQLKKSADAPLQCDELLIPAVMLRYERDLFLDNISVQDIERELGVKVGIVENNAEDFINKVLGIT